jgi:hypothetical protein
MTVPAAAPRAETDVPVDKIFQGTVATRVGNAPKIWCGIRGHESTFERSETGLRYISLAAVLYHYDLKTFRFGGLARLIFDGDDSGQVKFDLLGSDRKGIGDMTFTDYKQTYNSNSGRIRIDFDLNFDKCTVPVIGIYRD